MIRIRKVASVTHQPASFDIVSPGIGCWYPTAGRKYGKVHTPAVEKGIGTDEEGIDPLAHEVCKGRVDLAAGACVEDLDLQSEGVGSRLHIFHRCFGTRGVGRIDENGQSRHPGYHFAQEPQPLCCQLRDEEIDTRRVASWSSETCDHTELHRILANAENDRDSRGRSLCRERGRRVGPCDNHAYLPTDQIGHQLRISILLSLHPARFDRHILALDVARFIQALPEGDHPRSRFGFRQSSADDPDHRHRRLLRSRRQRPRRRAAEQRDERAALHSMTSSARCCKNHGTSSPSAFAALRLMTSSNLTGRSTGKSAGFAPFKILSTYVAARLCMSA